MKKILIIDDDHMIRNSVTSLLDLILNGYTVITAEDGQQGIDLIGSQTISLIITDIEMPKTDGYKVIDFVSKNHPTVPLIVMTGSWSSDLSRLASTVGGVRVIEKPFCYEELSCTVTEALGTNRDIATQ